MQALVAIPLACWICALVAIPRKPRFGNEVEELVYTRLLGRQRRLVLLAIAATLALLMTVVLGLPRQMTGQREAAQPQVQTTISCNDEILCPWMYSPR